MCHRKPLADALVYPPWQLQPAHFYTRLSFPSEWTPLRRNKTIKDTWELLRGGGDGRHSGEFIQGETEAAVRFAVLSGVSGECAGVRAAIGFLSADHVKEMMKNPLKPQRVQLQLTCVCLCVFVCDTTARLSGFQARPRRWGRNWEDTCKNVVVIHEGLEMRVEDFSVWTDQIPKFHGYFLTLCPDVRLHKI